MKYLREFSKEFIILILMFFSLNLAFASANVIDVQIHEYAHEVTTYNPLVTGSGLYFDANENQSVYVLNGTITVVNNHPTEAVENIVLNISNLANIYNLNYSSGSPGIIASQDVNSAILVIPDLGPGNSTIFTYDINTSKVEPPLNFTTSYSDSKIFAGLPIKVTDVISNQLNSALSNTCIYNISIVQNTIPINQSGDILNFTFDPLSIAGTDASNVSFSSDNFTSTWNLRNTACLNASQNSDINYDVLTPSTVKIADTYNMINSTINYNFNSAFSEINISSINGMTNLNLNFDKYLNKTLIGDNATWEISSEVLSNSNITVNLTAVTLWVSLRDGTGTGFTNPSIRDNDSISGADLIKTYTPNVLLNNSISPWNNSADKWYFNYTYSASPIVWMDIQNKIVNDGLQLTNSSVSYGNNSIYIKQIYLATGYWLEISKNITRLSDNIYNVLITVINKGTSSTPANQAVQVYNFIPNTFNLTSTLIPSTSGWYTTVIANETLNDPTYNGTMFQLGIIADGNPSNSSLDSYNGGSNINNTWTLTYNVTGNGQFNFDDLFLTGVDPLNVGEVGGTQSLVVDSVYGFLSSKLEYSLGFVAASLAALLLFL